IGVLLIELGAFGHGKIQHLGRKPSGQLRDHSHGNEGDELQDQVGKRTSPHLRDRHRAPGGAVHQEQRVAEGRRQDEVCRLTAKSAPSQQAASWALPNCAPTPVATRALAKAGSAMTTISSQSRKKPSTNTKLIAVMRDSAPL